MMRNVLALWLLCFCSWVWADTGTPRAWPTKQVEVNAGAGCQIAMSLPDDRVLPRGSISVAVSRGVTVGDPLPKSWKSTLNELYFSLSCQASDDSDSLNTLAYLDSKNGKWIKNEKFMQKELLGSSSDYAKEYFKEIIKVTQIYDLQTPNAHGWAETTEGITGDEKGRRRTLSFCLFHPPKAICGLGTVAQLADGPKGDLTQHALRIIQSIEFLPDATPSEGPRQ
jgi:hypothetical protein